MTCCRHRFLCFVGVSKVLLALCFGSNAASIEPAQTLSPTGPTGWNHQATDNFQVWAPCSISAGDVAKLLERGLERQRALWHADEDPQSWQPKCVVVVHDNVSDYRRAISSLRDTSVGTSTYAVKKGQIVSRRIDLRCDANSWTTDALPHELTHLVLADVFKMRPLPRWVDEGLAVLAESSAKQLRRGAELARAVAARATIPLPELLALEGPYASPRRDVFYSQSASLAAYLVQRSGAPDFCEFVRQSEKHGHDAALKSVYGIDDAGHLERLWAGDVLARQPLSRQLKLLAADR